MSKALAVKRIQKELQEIKKSPPERMVVGPSDDRNLFHWEGMLNGPDNSPYAGGVFKFVIDFPDDYPMKAPTVKFTTSIYHPNIKADGEICVDILKENWSSIYTISKVMLAIGSLLSDPNPASAYNGGSARLYITDRRAYDRIVKEWVRKYATPKDQ